MKSVLTEVIDEQTVEEAPFLDYLLSACGSSCSPNILIVVLSRVASLKLLDSQAIWIYL
jgi:hypothetical protein